MVIEMSADTYDWEGQERAAKGMIRAARDITNACQDAPDIDLAPEDVETPIDPEEALDATDSGGWSDWQACWAQIVEAHRDHLGGPEELKATHLDEEHSSDPGVRLTITTGANDHHYKLTTRYLPSGTVEVTALRMDLWSETASMVYVFNKADIAKLTNAQWERYLDEMEYQYRHRREAELLAGETLFSQREAEVLVLEREGWTDRYIARVTDISESTISTYRQRRNEKRAQAEQNKQEAERTVEVLVDAEDLPTSRCEPLPPEMGEAVLESKVTLNLHHEFVWLPDEYDTSSLVSGVPVASFYDGWGSHSLLVIKRPTGDDDYYWLAHEMVDEEAERFTESASERGRWIPADELGQAVA